MANTTPEARFIGSLSHEDERGCWIRSVSPTPRGYTQIRVGGKRAGAHRFSYELHIGEIPEGLTLDHLCRNPACVNPWHLEPVPQRVNTLRGGSPSAVGHATGRCAAAGHVLSSTSDGRQHCRRCKAASLRHNPRRLDEYRQYQREWQRQYRARKHAA